MPAVSPLLLMAVSGVVVAKGDVTSLAVLAFHRVVSHLGDIDCCSCQFSVIEAELLCLDSHYF